MALLVLLSLYLYNDIFSNLKFIQNKSILLLLLLLLLLNITIIVNIIIIINYIMNTKHWILNFW